MARKSQWSKGVEMYKEDLKRELKEHLAYRGKSLEDFKNMDTRERLESVFGIDVWREAERNRDYAGTYARKYSEGGCSLIYGEDIAERLLTPTQRKYYHKYDLIETQARACRQAYVQLVRELCYEV